jgi:hypothetical protein
MTLRDEFNSLSLENIQGFVTSGREEDLHLEFKTIHDDNLSRDDRKNLAVALSGFSNSDGGLVVWGVEARPNASGVDCAVALREIATASLCLTRLNELTGQCVSPLVDGVEHRVLFSNSNAGFCISVVPPSDSGPHMAKGGEDRYYKRSGSGFYRMEHFDLEDMFGRRQRPFIFLKVHLVPRAGEDPYEEVHFSIMNSGRGIAKHAGFFCRFEQGVTVAGVQGHLTNATSLNGGNPTVSYQDSVGVVHPNGIASSAGHAIIQRNAKSQVLNMQASLYCENMQVRSGAIRVMPSSA